MKTNPIGVRFRKDLLEKLEKDGIADSPQKALNFLTNFYHEHDPKKVSFEKAFKDSKLISDKPEEKKHKLWKKGDPPEKSNSFYLRYGFFTYDEIEKNENQ